MGNPAAACMALFVHSVALTTTVEGFKSVVTGPREIVEGLDGVFKG
jgi:hypothetical protein